MKKISEQELARINGGMSVTAIIGIGVLVTFIAGIIDGIARPLKCN